MINLLSAWTVVFLLIFSVLSVDLIKYKVIWTGNSAPSCDFVNSDLSSVRTSSERCRNKCNNTEGCTHFTWTSWNGGTCWMKSGLVARGDAFPTNDPDANCGVMQDSNDTYVADDIIVIAIETTTSQAGFLSCPFSILFVSFLFRFFHNL